MLSSDVLCLKKRKKKAYSLSSKIKEKQKKKRKKRKEEERCESGDGTTTAMLQVTEDTPPDMLAGAMDLTVHLPTGRTVKMAIERSTPMMDLLVQITTAHRLQLSGHTLEPLGMSQGGDDADAAAVLPYKPNTPIGTLDTRRVRVVRKPRGAGPRRAPPGHRPFESTFRLKVHLPRNQLYVTRVSGEVTLGEILAKVCEEKDLDATKYELRHPANLDEALDPRRSLGDYKITEIRVVCRGASDLDRAFSTNDIMALRKEEERKQMHTKTGGGVFNLIFRRGGAKSSIGSGSVSSDARSISPAPSDDSATAPRAAAAAQPPAPRPPARKRRPAPRPPPAEAGPAEPQICHSRNSSDSSGYHEASVLSDTLPRRPKSALVGAGAAGGDGAGLTKGRSRSTTNLSKMAYHSKSTTSLGVPPGRKKKAAPPPPPAVRASNPTINVEPASPIAVVASRAHAPAAATDARQDPHAYPVVAPQAPPVVANAAPVPRSRPSRPVPVPRAREEGAVAEAAQHQEVPGKPARHRTKSPTLGEDPDADRSGGSSLGVAQAEAVNPGSKPGSPTAPPGPTEVGRAEDLERPTEEPILVTEVVPTECPKDPKDTKGNSEQPREVPVEAREAPVDDITDFPLVEPNSNSEYPKTVPEEDPRDPRLPKSDPTVDPNRIQTPGEPEEPPTAEPKVAVIGSLQREASRNIFSSPDFLGRPPAIVSAVPKAATRRLPDDDLSDLDDVVFSGAKRPSAAGHGVSAIDQLFGIHDLEPERYSRTTSVTSLRSLQGFQPSGLKKWRNVEDLDDASATSWTAGDQSETESFSSHQLDSLASIGSGQDVARDNSRCFGSTDSGIAQEVVDHGAASPPPPPLFEDPPPSPPPSPPPVGPPPGAATVEEIAQPAPEIAPPPPSAAESVRATAPSPQVDLPADAVSEEQDAEWQFELPSPPKAFRDEEVPVVERPELVERLRELQEAPLNKLSLENLERRRSLVYNREIANSLKMADTFSGSLGRFESTYAEVRRSSSTATAATTTTTNLPNFRISTYDRPKERIKVFEDDTVRSNTNVTAEPPRSFGHQTWTPAKPVSRSRSQVALNGRRHAEEGAAEKVQVAREGVSRSNSLYDVSGLQSLGVMRLIQTKLSTSNRAAEEADGTGRSPGPETAAQAPKYHYRGPPTVNMGTWSDRPKAPVSVQGDVPSRLSASTRSDAVDVRAPPTVAKSDRQRFIERTTAAGYRRPLGALQGLGDRGDISRVPIVRSVEFKKPYRELGHREAAAPVVRGFRPERDGAAQYPWGARAPADRGAETPPPPTPPQAPTQRAAAPREAARPLEDTRDQLLSAIRNFGGKKGLRSVKA